MIKPFVSRLKKNDFGYFLFKLTLLFLIIFSLDFIIGGLLRFFYFKQESGAQYRSTYSLKQTTADVLIFGSSRANHHYYPDVFENRLNQSYYNVGRDGSSIFYHYAVLKSVLKRYKPKIIILDFVNEELKVNPQSYDRLSTLLPYYNDHPEIRSIVELKSGYEKLKLCSKIYPYNSSLLTIAAGNAEFNKKRKGDIQGYVPFRRVWAEPLKIENRHPKYNLDSNKVKAYTAFIKDCINANIKLYVVCSPYFIKSNSTDYSVKTGSDIAERYHVKFYNFSQNPFFLKNPSLFHDPLHLNDEGAKIFSSKLIESLSR